MSITEAHSHNLSGEDVALIPCENLTHCPSFCDHGADDGPNPCDVAVQSMTTVRPTTNPLLTCRDCSTAGCRAAATHLVEWRERTTNPVAGPVDRVALACDTHADNRKA